MAECVSSHRSGAPFSDTMASYFKEDVMAINKNIEAVRKGAV